VGVLCYETFGSEPVKLAYGQQLGDKILFLKVVMLLGQNEDYAPITTISD
jgi:hypothetical protein